MTIDALKKKNGARVSPQRRFQVGESGAFATSCRKNHLQPERVAAGVTAISPAADPKLPGRARQSRYVASQYLQTRPTDAERRMAGSAQR